MKHSTPQLGPVRLGALVSLAAMLSGCVVSPPRPARLADPPPPDTNIYAYPLKGQTTDQTDRDRYECYVWATRESGFDPSAPNVPPHDRTRVLAGPPGPPPGTGTAVGAITGAILGAAVSGPRDAGAGLLVGGLLGGAVGTAAEASANQQAQANARAMEDAEMRRYAGQMEQQAANFRRAASACLDARGYSVR
jgi:Glycine zipper 2TM domain